ncbi:hypothetical protein [Desulfosporosinus sp. SB140]|uniref:hypothetical protein n=1 Tax=Desulfosporosinus paludis TaxID=3115649 RepID=UPI00388F8C31
MNPTFWTTFWTNTIWFILLFLTSIITNVIILKKSNNFKFDLAFLFSIIGLSFIFEAGLVLRLNAYSYYPKIFRDTYLDIIFGNYFSQISVSTTALLLASKNLSFIWYGAFGLIYYFIEVIFLKLGIYEHFWYKSYYTFFGFILFSRIAKKWYKIAKKYTSKFINYITLYFSVASFSTFTIFLGQRLLGIQIYKSNVFFTDMNKNNTSTGFLYQFIIFNYLIPLYKSKLHWVLKTIALSYLFLAQYLAYRAGFIYIHKGLFFIVTSLDLIGCYFLIAVFDYLLFSNNKPTGDGKN